MLLTRQCFIYRRDHCRCRKGCLRGEVHGMHIFAQLQAVGRDPVPCLQELVQCCCVQAVTCVCLRDGGAGCSYGSLIANMQTHSHDPEA